MPPLKRKSAALRVSQLDTQAEFGFDVTLKRSPRRRTLEIIVRRGEVQLMLPQFVSHREGMQFLRRKRPWILKALHKNRQHSEESAPKQYVDGEKFHFLGEVCRLCVHPAKRSGVRLADGMLHVDVSARAGTSISKAVQKILWQWYRQQAAEILTRKTDALAEKIDRRYSGVRLRRTRTKWGHCTATGVIQYNWQIIAAREAVVDYLVAHEVSHLVHLNHGADFWLLVEKLCPDFRSHRHWLRTKGHTLVV